MAKLVDTTTVTTTTHTLELTDEELAGLALLLNWGCSWGTVNDLGLQLLRQELPEPDYDVSSDKFVQIARLS